MRVLTQRLFVILAGALISEAEARPTPVLFESDIRPILKAHCFHCHGEGEKLKGDIDLRLRRFMDREVESHRLVVNARPKDSLLLKVVKSGEMPKGEKKLSPEQVKLIETWIQQGAKTLRPEPAELPKGFYLTEEEKNFWSFQPIRRPALPKVQHPDKTRVRNPIDSFILAQLKGTGLRMAPAADPRSLIRRAYIDLLGIPPTPEEVSAFVKDYSAETYEQLIDRLLASPLYGERWGRHWLDLAGYADSNGYTEADSVRPHAWRYRDYVIRSFNQDKPFNRFVVEQLAGDELAGAPLAHYSTEQAELMAATGFLQMAPDGTGDNVPDAKLARNQVIADTLKIVGSSLMGLTLNCAQCHDHRYDPISQEDYYRVRAIFDPAFDWQNWRAPAQRLVSLYTPEEKARAQEIEVEAQKLDAAAKQKHQELLDKVFEREILKVPEDLREKVRVARNTAVEKRTEEQKALFLQYPAADVRFALDLYDPAAFKELLKEMEKATKLRGTKPAEGFVMAATEVPGKSVETFLFNRGDHDQPKQKVAPGAPLVLASHRPLAMPAVSSEKKTSGRRLAFAENLTDGQHPLTARVLVNHFWLHHFGRGIVNTPGDFGMLGERPTHPELLDWLANEFMAQGWSLKKFHKLVMLSATYQQSSLHPVSSQKDPENRFYTRMKLRRLDAEALRDSVLAASGSLNPTQYGAPVSIARDSAGRVITGTQQGDANGDPTGVTPLGAADGRRSIYVQVRRKHPLTVLETFDAPAMTPNCELRPSTTVAPQSLLLLNDSFIVEQSQRFAARVELQHPEKPMAQIERAWALVFGVDPEPWELTKCLEMYNKQVRTLSLSAADGKKRSEKEIRTLAMASVCQVLFGSNRFLYVH